MFRTTMPICASMIVNLSDPMNDQHDGGSISRNYTGQIQEIVITKDSLSFQLLNAAFESIKEFENSCEKRNASIIVKRSRLVQQGEEFWTPPFMYNETDTSSNANDVIQPYVSCPVIIYNVTQGNYTHVAQSYSARIKSCVFCGNKVSFIFQETSWLENATFTTCDNKGFILHSIFIDVQGSSLETTKEYHKLSTGPKSTHESSSSNENSRWLLISAVVVLVVATCMAIFAFTKLRNRGANAVPTSETNDATYRNKRKPTAKGLRNLYPNVKEADAFEESRMFSASNQNSENVTDITNNKDLAKSKPKHVHRLSITNSTESIAEPWFEYDYVVHHRFMTLRPPAPDPVVTRKSKEEVTIAKSISWYEIVNEISSLTVYLSTFFANANRKRTRGCHCIVSISELGSRKFINHLAPPGYFDLEDIQATRNMTSSCCLSYDGGRNRGNAENLESSVLARPECLELPDSESRHVAQFFNYENPRSYYDHSPATGRKHRRSQSFGEMMDIASFRWARRKSARTYVKNKYTLGGNCIQFRVWIDELSASSKC